MTTEPTYVKVTLLAVEDDPESPDHVYATTAVEYTEGLPLRSVVMILATTAEQLGRSLWEEGDE